MNHNEKVQDQGSAGDRKFGFGALIVNVMIYPILTLGWLERQLTRLISSRKDYVTSKDPSVLPYDKLVEGGTRQGLVPEPPRYR